jgi:alpha-galactosidase
VSTPHNSVVLHNNTTLFVLDLSEGTPAIAYWGANNSQNVDAESLTLATREAIPHAELDTRPVNSLGRENSRGWLGRNALEGHRGQTSWSPWWAVTKLDQSDSTARIVCSDADAGLNLTWDFEIENSGLVRIQNSVTNTGSAPYSLQSLDVALPLPARAQESMDFTGRWLKERQAQRRTIQTGTWSREIREGRSGPDNTIVELALTPGAGFRHGEVWSVGLEWSGNSRYFIERQPHGETIMGAGEILLPGEIQLGQGESYSSPPVLAGYSNKGIDGISAMYHSSVRSRAPHISKKPRPLTLNVWEAVYFDHSLDGLSTLAERAAEVGIERFVLDDGWFRGRRDDTAGLGDWSVDPVVWPSGLGPIISKVHELGMEFGLWFEGEMVNPDSDLYRTHPDWILQVDGRVPPTGRNQLVLDLSRDDVYEYILTSVDTVLTEYPIDYIKWDHNKYLIEPGSSGRPAARAQTVAIYRLFDELKRRHPGLEIESCASGGGRIDLGMATHADRFWTSDCTDPIERQLMQRYTGIAIPPEMLGAHIGAPKSHTTFKSHSLETRAISALFGHAGVEWDLQKASYHEISVLQKWAAYYLENRGLLHAGKVVRVDGDDQLAIQHGVVANNGSKAIFSYVLTSASPWSRPPEITFPGLSPERVYSVKLVTFDDHVEHGGRDLPPWCTKGLTLSGALLESTGVRPPVLRPETGILIELVAID